MLGYLFLVMGLLCEVRCELSHGISANANVENETGNELEMGRSRLRDRYPVGELPIDSANCHKPAKCIEISNNTLCMGTKLPYSSTTLDLIPEPITEVQIKDRLQSLQGLRHIPKCWAVIQPFLCSVFMPKCVNNTVDLPSQEICKIVSGPCRLVFNHTSWPSFIRCENAELFPKLCKNDIRELKFNTTGQCLKPLVPTDNVLSIFEGVEGCGTECNDPLFRTDEQRQIHSVVAWASGICFACNLFTVVTFLIDWKSGNKYPAVVIFYINTCFMVFCIGWLVQFTPGSREVIVCRKDGTLRMSEPSGENLSCVVVFILIYYFLMAAMVWFVILTYIWHITYQAVGKIKDRIDKKRAYFHLIAWCLPLVLTVTIMALGEIDGNSVTGICFVGYANHTVRAWFLLGPILAALLIGGYFLTRGLKTLIDLKRSSHEKISKQASSKIRETIVRTGLFSVFLIVAVFVTFYCHIYEFQNSWKWKQSFRDYMICSLAAKYADVSECKMTSKPSVGKLQLHLLSPFFAGGLMSTWVWTESTRHTWIRFLRRVFNREVEEPIKLEKWKAISRAFAKRNTFKHDGRLSISFQNTPEDPVGLNFDLNSVASQDFSSTWAAALPKLVTRRGAITGGTTGSVSSNRRNSVDSEMSFSVRRVSVESRRNSVDSQISVQIAEMKTIRKVASTTLPGSSRSRRGKRRRRDFGKTRSGKVGPLFRRGSTTSQESQLGAQILSALTIGGNTNVPSLQMPNMKRRSASAGLDARIINSNILDVRNAGILLPFSFPGQSESDENLSSEEKCPGGTLCKDANVEAGNVDEDEQDSESENSHAEEDTKMLDVVEPPERSRSKTSNKSTKSYNNHDSGRRSKEIKVKNIEVEMKDIYRMAGIGDAVSNLTAYSPELTLLLQSDDSKTKLPKRQNDDTSLQTSAREMATQTSLPLDILEMEELNQSIDKIINSRNCSSKGTQISPQLNKTTNRKSSDIR